MEPVGGLGFEIVFTLALHWRLVSFRTAAPLPPKTTTDMFFFLSLSFFPHRLDKRRRRVVLTVRVFPVAQLFTVHHSAISHYTTLWFVIISVLKCPKEGLLPLCQPPSRHETRKQRAREDFFFSVLAEGPMR